MRSSVLCLLLYRLLSCPSEISLAVSTDQKGVGICVGGCVGIGEGVGVSVSVGIAVARTTVMSLPPVGQTGQPYNTDEGIVSSVPPPGMGVTSIRTSPSSRLTEPP